MDDKLWMANDIIAKGGFGEDDFDAICREIDERIQKINAITALIKSIDDKKKGGER